ncbi:hypothetical protein SSBR45G_16380 [Bradyrhizobium sp. SSBR45G]|uniref:hypothetical protein n=1 Tax=unclassified Bradyrhizobium TaxID=2631580 RepID=UPI00234292F2|nr:MULTISPECIES: hypothetical protein [unclassified Bradyrhizobium]GLH76730.1 hypothetical protein SSBR45G_16380 [Bradyrhizobium sp. SSBR45G]GLH83488.1 hypothetical protein SSBR45R_09480 [Bradyrhizobium sp. SSBR45R]
MSDTTQQKSIDLARGLFLVRYNGAEDKASPPIVRVAPDRSSIDSCTVITSPDSVDGTLYSPDSALVVSVVRPSRLTVEVIAQQPGGSTAANVKIEPLTQGQKRDRSLPSRGGAVISELPDLQVLAHVAGIGDVTEASNAWVAGPTAPARIEGICLLWPNKPHDLDVQYAVRFARPQRGDNQLVPLGTFAGTRGRALPLTGISLEALGAGANRYNFAVEAIFLGAPAMRVTGRRINLSGPSGREPLVGLKISIEETPPTILAAPAARAAIDAGSPRSGGRVRVFRSRQSAAKPGV